MPLQYVFWTIYIIVSIAVLFFNWPDTMDRRAFRPLGTVCVLLILIGILGYAEFGPAVQDESHRTHSTR